MAQNTTAMLFNTSKCSIHQNLNDDLKKLPNVSATFYMDKSLQNMGIVLNKENNNDTQRDDDLTPLETYHDCMTLMDVGLQTAFDNQKENFVAITD